jgi:hypothetical protein
MERGMRYPLHLVLSSAFIAMSILLPAVSFAAVRNAGLIDGVWFSSNEPIEDAPETLYAGVLNQSADAISGTVSFASDGVALGTTTFSVSPDQIQRVGLTSTFKAGSHAISARVASINDAGSVAYTELTERILVVDAKPIPVVPSNTNASSAIISLSTTTFPASSTVGSAVRSTASVVNSLGGSITSATAPLIKSVTTSRDQILGHTSTSTAQTSPLDVISPSKNLFDVTLDIASQANKHSMWDTLHAFLLSLLAWILYCIVPIALLLIIIFGFRWLSHRNHR